MLARRRDKQSWISRLLLVCAFGLGWVGAPGTTWGQAKELANPLLQRGLSLYNEQKYEAAIKSFEGVLKWPKSSKDQRENALKYLGFSYIVMGKADDAKKAFFRLLKSNPEFSLSAWDPPKFRNFFGPVKEEFELQRKVQIINKNPSEFPSDKPLSFKFQVKDGLRRMEKLFLYYRIKGKSGYVKKELKDDKGLLAQAQKKGAKHKEYTFTYPLPAGYGKDQEGAYFLQFYLEALDASGTAVSSLGTAEAPKQLKRTFGIDDKGPPPTLSTPVHKTWWFWTIIGVAVAGGAAVAVVAVVQSLPPPVPETGSVSITIVR